LCLAACSLHKPDFRELSFRPSQDPQIFEATALGRTVQLIEPDSVVHPKEFLGPLRIAGACTANVSQVITVYASRDVNYLIAINHTGETQFAHFIDIRSCRELWPPLKATVPIQVTGDAIQIEKGTWLRLSNETPPNV